MKELEQTADTILEQPIEISFTVQSKNWLGKKTAVKRVYPIHPLKLGSLVRISKILLTIDGDVFKKNTMLDANYHLFNDNLRSFAEIVAIAIINGKDAPPASLIDELVYNLTTKELLQVIEVIMQQMDIASFMRSIISIKGANLLQMSPMDQGRDIASGEQLEE